MSAADSVLFIDYATTVKLLPVPDAMAICEDVFRMHARNSVKWSVPPSQRLDVGAPFHNHWHVKTVILEDEPIAGVRLYSYYDDGLRNTVGRLDCARYAPGGLRHHEPFHCRPHHSSHRQRRYRRQQCRHDLHARRSPTAEPAAGDDPESAAAGTRAKAEKGSGPCQAAVLVDDEAQAQPLRAPEHQPSRADSRI
jgi:hypothetical protein